MEKFEKEARLSSIDEQLETEKQKKIDNVIQNAKKEENDLQLETMGNPPETCDECRDDIREMLTPGYLKDVNGTYRHEKEFVNNTDGNLYRNVIIELDRNWDIEVMKIYFEYVDWKNVIWGKKRHHWNYYYKREKKEGEESTFRRRNFDDPSFSNPRRIIRKESKLTEMQLYRTLVDSAQFEEDKTPDKKWSSRNKPNGWWD